MSMISHSPRVHGRLKPAWLAAAAALSIALWFAVEQALQRPIHSQFAEMLMAAIYHQPTPKPEAAPAAAE